MNFKRKILFSTFMTAVCAALAMPMDERAMTTRDGRIVEVVPMNENTFRVRNYLPGQDELTSNGLNWASSTCIVSRDQIDDDLVAYTTGQLDTRNVAAIIDPGTGAVTLIGGPTRTVIDNGLRPTADGKMRLELATTSLGAFYGAGERGHKLNLRGDTLVMYNRPTYGYGGGDPRINQMNITMPVVLSSDGFAIVFDDYAASTLTLSNPIVYETEAPGAVSYYFINGVETLADVVENLTEITGRQNLPPFWALGYITSKYGYRTQAETEAVVDTLKREGYPLDGLVLDLYWYGKEQDMGRLDWESSQWPDPRKMLASLSKKGVNVVPISQPYVLRNGRGVENYDSLAPKGVFVMDSVGAPLDVEIWVGKGGMFDVSNPDTRAWMAKRYGELTDMGVAGWWGDLGEPEQHPEAGRHANGLKAREYHNRYGNDWSSIIYDFYRERYPERRPFLLMRGGTTGLQCYSVFPWSGDVARSWGGIVPQIPIMINSGLSGLGYMSHDVGGFAIDEEHPIDPELYVRWLQLGLFSPVLRTHSQMYAEPYHYPDQAEIIKKLIADRYRWLPYNYTLAYENSAKGWPLVRPLNFHDAGPAGCDTIVDEYLWGRDVLVAPVLKQGAVSRDIVFPSGRWIDMNDPRVSYEGVVKDYPAPLSKLPLFVREGAFIPMADYKMDNTGDYDPSRLTVNYYAVPGVKSSYTLYDDDRLSPQVLDEEICRLITFDGDCAENGDCTITISSVGTYDGAPSVVNIDFKVPGAKSVPRSVTVDGKAVKWKMDKADGTLSFKVKYAASQAMYEAGQKCKIEIKY